jgi:CCR4-NOT transcriptional complex subunit CAF120
MADYFAGGRPSTDRAWTECFAQLVGTVLSLWDATALDAAGADGEVLPTFINVSDASIKMVSTVIITTSNLFESLIIRRRLSRFQ